MLIRFPKIRELLIGEKGPVKKIQFVEDAVKNYSKQLVCAPERRTNEKRVRTRRHYRMKKKKSYSTLFVSQIDVTR
jgi:hypothetical protein